MITSLLPGDVAFVGTGLTWALTLALGLPFPLAAWVAAR